VIILLYIVLLIKNVINNRRKKMTNEEAIKALKEIKTYTAAVLLDELDYVIAVMEKLNKEGIKNPLDVDFSKLK
jgi:phage terminase small subunit